MIDNPNADPMVIFYKVNLGASILVLSTAIFVAFDSCNHTAGCHLGELLSGFGTAFGALGGLATFGFYLWQSGRQHEQWRRQLGYDKKLEFATRALVTIDRFLDLVNEVGALVVPRAASIEDTRILGWYDRHLVSIQSLAVEGREIIDEMAGCVKQAQIFFPESTSGIFRSIYLEWGEISGSVDLLGQLLNADNRVTHLDGVDTAITRIADPVRIRLDRLQAMQRELEAIFRDFFSIP